MFGLSLPGLTRGSGSRKPGRPRRGPAARFPGWVTLGLVLVAYLVVLSIATYPALASSGRTCRRSATRSITCG